MYYQKMSLSFKLNLVALTTATVLLSGCGGGGGGSTPTVDTTGTGYFIDSAVEGVDYTCGTLTGTTDSTGKFTYDSAKCSSVEFKLGSLSLGSISIANLNPDTYLTVQELAGVARDNVTDGNVTKLAVLLQSLDDDNNASNGIYITQNIKNAITLTGNIKDKSDTEISNEITKPTINKSVKDVNDALTHILQTFTTKGITTAANINPTDFNLTSVSGSLLSIPVQSNTITLQGLTTPTYITIANGEYSINGGAWQTSKSLVKNDDNITVRHTTANDINSTTTTTLKIGGVTKTFGSTTRNTLTFQSGDTWKGLTYNTITSPTTGKVWLDRNLGASQACMDANDSACFGDYYQWGREADGHEKSNSTTTTTQASTISNVGNQLIISGKVHGKWEEGDIYDWVVSGIDDNSSLRITNWSKTDGSSICPIGYRVPTLDELLSEYMTNSDSAFSKLKIPLAGGRDFSDGILTEIGTANIIWSTSAGEFTSFGLFTKPLPYDYSHGLFLKTFASPVRCLRGEM